MEEQKVTGLPENASRELAKGEVYEPVMSPNRVYPEVNLWSVGMGLLMTIIFSAAAAYLGLRVGQVFEAAIPIAIIATGLSGVLKRKNALGENIIIQSIGACSGAIVAGAIFTLPALYILELDVDFFKIFLSSLLGGVLGILFLIPFRKYFVSDMHGKYPFPEATATTQVLVSAETGGNSSKLLLMSGLVGGLYDFVVSSFGLWAETFSSRVLPFGEVVAEKAKLLVKLNLTAAVLGLGYVIGLKYAFIICCGSFLVWFVIVPMLNMIFGADTVTILGTTFSGIDAMTAEEIFKTYARHIGIGGIATAGIIGIVKSSSIIKSAFSLAVKEFKNGSKNIDKDVKRTQRDISMKIIAFGILITLAVVFVFFYMGVVPNLFLAIVALLIVAVIAFLFTTVAANAIAIVGTNPVSGMTLMTLILGSVILVACGLQGVAGMTASLIIGGVVCTALSVSGAFITDLKIGYWLGATPKKQETWKFLGTLVAAATVGGVMLILKETYGFDENDPNALVAPQANAMAAVIKPLMSGQGADWFLYGIGAVLALILNFAKIPALAFALGMFIPLELNLPLLVGGAVAWFVGSRSKNELINKIRNEKGTLIASGFIAGGALMGVVSAIIKYFGFNWSNTQWSSSDLGQYLGLFMYALLIVYLAYTSIKSEKNK